MPSQRIHNLLPSLALTAAVLLWGSSFPVMKTVLNYYHPLVAMGLRMLFGALGLAVFFARFRRGARYRKGDWKLLFAMALCEPCLYFLFETYALVNTSSSQAGMVAATMPILVGVGAWLFLGERTSRRSWLGFVLSIAGVCWLTISAKSTAHAPNPWLGNTLEFTAMCCAAGYMVLARHLSTRYSPWFITAVQAFAGAVFFMPTLLLPGIDLPTNVTLWPLVGLVYLGIFVTIGAYGFYNYGNSRLPASQASAFINLIPVTTLILGKYFLNETFTLSQYAASALVLIGVTISQDRKARQARAPRPKEKTH